MATRAGTTPFRHWIIDDWHEPLNRNELGQALLHNWEVFYDNDVERGKKTSRSFGSMIPKLKSAFGKLFDEWETLQWLQELTGIKSLICDPISHGAGLHLSTCGSFLQAHCDYEVHPEIQGKERRINALLFMHPQWDPEWGGQLLLSDMSGNPVVEIDPKPGRLALFECGPDSMHGVRVIKNPEAVRLSCAAYYLADARPTAVRRRAMFLPNRVSGGVPREVS